MAVRMAVQPAASKAVEPTLPPWLAWKRAVESSPSVGPAPALAVKMVLMAADRVRMAALTSSRGMACKRWISLRRMVSSVMPT